MRKSGAYFYKGEEGIIILKVPMSAERRQAIESEMKLNSKVLLAGKEWYYVYKIIKSRGIVIDIKNFDCNQRDVTAWGFDILFLFP